MIMENKQIKLTDEVVIPVILKHNITREEAEKRLQLLFQSGIMQAGDPGDPETQQYIDEFLARDSEENAALVLLDKTITECLENKEFIKQYDRLHHRNFSQCLIDIENGKPPKSADKQFKKFGDFVRRTVFWRLVHSQAPDA